MNTSYRQISRFDYRSEKLRYLLEQNSNFGDARRITAENALTDLYIYLFETKIVETIDTAAVRQIVASLCHVVSFKVKKQLQTCRQNRFRKTAETAIHTKSKQSQSKTKYLTMYSVNISLYYSTQQYCLYFSTSQTNLPNYFFYTKNLRNTINSSKN